MTDEQAENAMEFLFAAYPYVVEKTPEITLNLYLAFLMTLPVEIGQAAVIKLIQGNKYFPTIAEIKEAAQSFAGKTNEIPVAELAWEEVRSKLDPYKTPVWSHPVIEKVVKTIGYRNLCDSRNPGADMAHFLKIYESYRKRILDETENESIRRITSNIVNALPTGGLKRLGGGKEDG